MHHLSLLFRNTYDSLTTVLFRTPSISLWLVGIIKDSIVDLVSLVIKNLPILRDPERLPDVLLHALAGTDTTRASHAVHSYPLVSTNAARSISVSHNGGSAHTDADTSPSTHA